MSVSSPSKEGKEGWGARLAASIGIAKESAATKLFRSFQEKALAERKVKEAQEQRAALIEQALSTHWACKTLSAERRKLLSDTYTEVVFSPGEKITQAGERGDSFYLIEEGEVEVVLEGDLMLHVVLPEQLGGGKSTMRQSRETTPAEIIQHIAKIRGSSPSLVFEIRLIGEADEKVLPVSIPLSTYASGTDRLNLRVQLAPEEDKEDKMRSRNSVSGQPRLSTSESDGKKVARKRIESLQVLERGACFGELGLIFGTTRHHTVRVRAARPVRCLAFHRETVQMAFAGSPVFACLSVLRTSPIMTHLSTWHLARVAAEMNMTSFQAGEVLLQKSAVCEDLAVVPDGIVRDNSVESKAVQFYGDTAVFLPVPEPSLWDIVAETSGLVCRLHKTTLLNVLGTEFQRLQDRVVQRDEEGRARQRAWREQALGSHWLLKSLPAEAKRSIVDAMFARFAEDGSIILMQGQRADFCYILEKGKAEVWEGDENFPAGAVGKEGCLKQTLLPGAVFGDLAIMFNAKRSATVTAKGPALMQCIPEHIFLTALQDLQASKQNGSLYLEHALFLQQCECVSGVGIWALSQMVETLRRDTFQPGQELFKQGDVATRFYLLQQGEVQCLVNGKVTNTFQVGQQFGEAVATETVQPHTAVAVSLVHTLSVDKEVFHTVWSQVCTVIKDRERMAAKAKRLRRKAQVVDEFVQSESLYASFLHILIDEFLMPLRAILNEGQVQKMFSNVEMLSDFHDHISSDLATRNVGGVLVKYADSLQCYTPYVRNFDEAGELVKTLSKSHKGFQKFLADKREHPEAVGGLDLLSYLIMPVQRIPRYRMLLEEIFRFSDSEDKDTADLALALTKIKAVALGVNEAKRQFEEEEALAKAVNSIVGKITIPLLAPHRKVITELDNMVASNKKLKGSFRLIVFNDMLVVVKQVNSHYRGVFEFSACTIHLFYNVSEKKAQGVSMVPLLSSGLGGGDKPGVFSPRTSANTLGKESKFFSHATPCAFVFMQSSPEQIQRANKLVDTAQEWSKEE